MSAVDGIMRDSKVRTTTNCLNHRDANLLNEEQEWISSVNAFALKVS